MELERAMRNETKCRGCGSSKSVGCVVCWDCFKYRKQLPFKYYEGTLQEWLDAVHALPIPETLDLSAIN
jgi:hypothetical protein